MQVGTIKIAIIAGTGKGFAIIYGHPFHPFVAPSGSIDVDGGQADVPAAQFGANAVHPPAALIERNVFLFRNQLGSIVMLSLEFGHHTPSDFTRVRPFKETAVRASLSCSFPAVPIVD